MMRYDVLHYRVCRSEVRRALNRPNRECPRSSAYGERVLSHADDGACPDFAFVHRELGRYVRRVDWVERFAREAGFEIVLFAPRTPETKGKVESANRFLSRLAAYEDDFDGWEGLDAAIAHIERRGNEEPNDTTGVPPELLFMREKDAQAAGQPGAAGVDVGRRLVPGGPLHDAREVCRARVLGA